MKKFSLNTGLICASWALLLMFGCHKKKPPIPPEETPPTIISQIPTQPTEAKPSPQTGQQKPPEQQASNTPAPEKPAHKPPKHPKVHNPPRRPANEPEKPAPIEEARNVPPSPPRVVIQEGGANPGSGQVSSGAPSDGGATAQSSTQQLLDSTENNLRNITKYQLSSDEQSMVSQIRDYMKESRDATKDGDSVRAHNLALKARLLSDELMKAH
jgi:type IV secretory pathway VirB10-like protein